ncbi:hypothetical protein F5887DRAFT_923691 [Amanita rubescens]|nr:hypothetical protein F5887DRAFT_923691 [Amanita rubescens]
MHDHIRSRIFRFGYIRLQRTEDNYIRRSINPEDTRIQWQVVLTAPQVVPWGLQVKMWPVQQLASTLGLPQNVYPPDCPAGHLQLDEAKSQAMMQIIISYSLAGGNVRGSGGTDEGEDNYATECSELHKRRVFEIDERCLSEERKAKPRPLYTFSTTLYTPISRRYCYHNKSTPG